eukprot:SAG11_NODE_792_length_7143_cov_38.103492_1_plen_139_part_00
MIMPITPHVVPGKTGSAPDDISETPPLIGVLWPLEESFLRADGHIARFKFHALAHFTRVCYVFLYISWNAEERQPLRDALVFGVIAVHVGEVLLRIRGRLCRHGRGLDRVAVRVEKRVACGIHVPRSGEVWLRVMRAL